MPALPGPPGAPTGPSKGRFGLADTMGIMGQKCALQRVREACILGLLPSPRFHLHLENPNGALGGEGHRSGRGGPQMLRLQAHSWYTGMKVGGHACGNACLTTHLYPHSHVFIVCDSDTSLAVCCVCCSPCPGPLCLQHAASACLSACPGWDAPAGPGVWAQHAAGTSLYCRLKH